jgi:predicted nucleic acid-binding protein
LSVFVDSNIPMYVAGGKHENQEPARRFLDRARDLLCDTAGISARDAVHAAVMLNHEVEWIATFDAGFDRVRGLRRLKVA